MSNSIICRIRKTVFRLRKGYRRYIYRNTVVFMPLPLFCARSTRSRILTNIRRFEQLRYRVIVVPVRGGNPPADNLSTMKMESELSKSQAILLTNIAAVCKDPSHYMIARFLMELYS